MGRPGTRIRFLGRVFAADTLVLGKARLVPHALHLGRWPRSVRASQPGSHSPNVSAVNSACLRCPGAFISCARVSPQVRQCRK